MFKNKNLILDTFYLLVIRLSACVEIPQCLNVKVDVKNKDIGKVLLLKITNTCNYDLTASLFIKNRKNVVLNTIPIELNASEEKQLEIPITTSESIIISGEWGLKGMSFKLKLEEIILEII